MLARRGARTAQVTPANAPPVRIVSPRRLPAAFPRFAWVSALGVQSDVVSVSCEKLNVHKPLVAGEVEHYGDEMYRRFLVKPGHHLPPADRR